MDFFHTGFVIFLCFGLGVGDLLTPVVQVYGTRIMCDGNRRPNYDGCLLPPQFIGPGDKYNIPETHRIHDFFKARDSPTGFKTGKGIWLDYRHGAVHAQPNVRPTFDRKKEISETLESKEYIHIHCIAGKPRNTTRILRRP